MRQQVLAGIPPTEVLAATKTVDVDATVPDNFGTQPIHAVMSGNRTDTIAIMNLLLENGADINALENYGKTPIFFALRSNPEILTAIIAAGADITLQDKDGRSLLHTAHIGSADEEVKAFLIEAGVDLTLLGEDARTAYDMALESGQYEENLALLAALKPAP